MPVQTERTKDSHGWIGSETINTRFGNFEFKGGYPTAETADKLYELLTFSRAVESYLHFVTIMSMFYTQKGLNDFGLDAANKFGRITGPPSRPADRRSSSNQLLEAFPP
jgi:hypothetical protein